MLGLILAFTGCQGSTIPVVDLVVDANRNGRLEPGLADEDGQEDAWDAFHGAVFLANLDDDDRDGRPDGQDDFVNGPADILDLMVFQVQPWSDAPGGTRASLTIDSMSQGRVRVFRVDGPADDPASYVSVEVADIQLDADALRKGATFALEGREVVTSLAPDAWNGMVELGLTIFDERSMEIGADLIRARVAPLLFQYNTLPTERIYYSLGESSSPLLFLPPGDQAKETLIGHLEGLARTGEVSLEFLNMGGDPDRWTQDFFDVAHMTHPGPDGRPVGMKVFLRSPQADREAGQWVTEHLLGPDAAALFIHDEDTELPGHSWSLSSMGNFDVVPPYEKDGQRYPLGRSLYGAGEGQHEQPDAVFTDFVRAQRVQPEITIDVSFLLVGHVDEIVTFVRAPKTERGWVMLIAEPLKARKMLVDLQSQGLEQTTMFSGRTWIDWDSAKEAELPAEITVGAALRDPDLMAANQAAQVKIQKARDKLQAELGLANSEIVALPFLFERTSGGLLAYQSNTVNLLEVDGTVIVPDTFGPAAGGRDPFRADAEARLKALGVTVSFVDVWNEYHRYQGEVHCATNVTRKFDAAWWESGR